jgi:hypothetical protein
MKHDEHIATYIYDPIASYGVYEIYAIYDSIEDRDNREVSYYEIFDKDGVCVTEGVLLYSIPTWQEVFDNYYSVLRTNY